MDLERSEDKLMVESNILAVSKLVVVEVTLIAKERELKGMLYAEANGVMVDFDLMHELKEFIDLLKIKINEGVR